MMSTEESEQSSAETHLVPIGSTGLSINLSFVKSRLGIFEVVIIVLSMICWICSKLAVEIECIYFFGSGYGFYIFVAASVFLTYLLNYLIFVIHVDEKWCMRLVPWLVWHFVVAAFFTFLYLIASIVMVSHICGQSGFAAAAVFAFITTIVLGVETYFLLLSLRQDHAPTDIKFLNMLGVPPRSSSSPQSHEYYNGSLPDSKY